VREPDDDAHHAAAVGTDRNVGTPLMGRVQGRRLDILWRRLLTVIGEKGAAESELGCAVTVGHEAEVADTVEPVGQGVKEEAANEFAGLELHDLGGAALTVILPSKGDMVVVEGDEAAVGNGDAVSVAPEIGENLGWSSERLLGIDDPVDMPHGGEMGGEGRGLGEIRQIAEEA
jgi:hypothetical protein